MLISVVIPTFNEEKLDATLYRLFLQTVFEKYKGQIEVIIADYDPERNGKIKKVVSSFDPKRNIKYVPVERKGIAYARHKGILASKGHTIVNFDADAYYSHPNCIDLCIRPILNNECVLTCCDNMLNIHELDETNHKHENVLIVRMAYTVASRIQKDGMIVIYEPGMCFSRYAYDFSGGFNDVKQSEGMFLSSRIIYNFGFGAKRHIPDAAVVVSARRATASSKYGLIDTWFNYDNAFRESEKFTL